MRGVVAAAAFPAAAAAACWQACSTATDCASCPDATCWGGVCDPCQGKKCGGGAVCPSACSCSFGFCSNGSGPTPPVTPTPPPVPPPPPPPTPPSNCTLSITSTLSDPIYICQSKGPLAPPGNYAQYKLSPGATVSYACPVTADPPGYSDSYLTYLTVRNAVGCPTDSGCANNTVTCKTYPWAFSGNVGDQHEAGGRYYTALYTNHDGDIPDHPAGALPTGWGGDYSSADVSYGISLSCTDGTIMPNPGALDLSCSASGPGCTPSQPYCAGFPDTGIHTCKIGGADIKMTIG